MSGRDHGDENDYLTPGVSEAIRMTDVSNAVKRTTFRRWDHGQAQVTVMPEVPQQDGTKLTVYRIGIDHNPMSREELVELRDLVVLVLEECPPERIVAALDPAKGLSIGPAAPGPA